MNVNEAKAVRERKLAFRRQIGDALNLTEDTRIDLMRLSLDCLQQMARGVSEIVMAAQAKAMSGEGIHRT